MRYLIQIRDLYFEWSTIVDAPVTYGLKWEQMEEHVRALYGSEGEKELPARLERIKQQGTSCEYHLTMEALLHCNRAGPEGTELTSDQIYEAYKLPT